MSSKAERDRLENELKSLEFDLNTKKNMVDVQSMYIDDDVLPALSESNVKELDYDAKLADIETESNEIIDNMAELFINNDVALSHPYIQQKKRKDAEYFAKLDFLVKSSQDTLISIMQDISSGNSNSRMYEVQAMAQKEMRDNIKLAQKSLSDIEKFYSDIKDHFGDEVLVEGDNETPTMNGGQDEFSSIIQNGNFNDELDGLFDNGQIDMRTLYDKKIDEDDDGKGDQDFTY